MAIVSSIFVLDAHEQIDGTRWCKELHTDSEGREQSILYKLPAGQGDTEATANMNARVAVLNEDLRIAEAQRLIDKTPAVTLVLHHQTAAQFADRFWDAVRLAYARGEKLTFARLIHWVHGRVQAGDITNNQVRLSFNAAYGRSLTLAQWNAFVTSTLVPIVDRYQAMLDQADL